MTEVAVFSVIITEWRYNGIFGEIKRVHVGLRRHFSVWNTKDKILRKFKKRAGKDKRVRVFFKGIVNGGGMGGEKG